LKCCHSLGSSIDTANVVPEMPGMGKCSRGEGGVHKLSVPLELSSSSLQTLQCACA